MEINLTKAGNSQPIPLPTPLKEFIMGYTIDLEVYCNKHKEKLSVVGMDEISKKVCVYIKPCESCKNSAENKEGKKT